MGMVKRRKPYFWVTWIAAALAGDKSCEYAPWLKSHYKADELEETPERAKQLAQWKADHAAIVRHRAEELRSQGYAVTVEGENKFTVYGKNADVGGAMDVVAIRGDEVRVEDVKTGKKKDEHYWQVVLYILMLPKTKAKFMSPTSRLTGAIVYHDSVREIDGIEAANEASRVFGRITEIATNEVAPPKSPGSECAFCKIADCDARAPEGGTQIDTEDF